MKNKYYQKYIEYNVQIHWKEKKTFHVIEDYRKEKYYSLSMFPYPSGRLHMGHVRNYTISDVLSRYQRMLGKNVLQPIGWDAFGLPAEEAAFKNKKVPAIWTYDNISYMKNQIKKMGWSYDWDREITTCDQEYYRWEQWFFTKLYEKGLVYKKTSIVNWCPKDLTVLANEQVMEGCCWRCESNIERKYIPQWFLKITLYSDQLWKDIEKLEYWPNKVKKMQRNWIGHSEGIEIYLKNSESNDNIRVYSTIPERIIFDNYIKIAIEHPIVQQEMVKNTELSEFIIECHFVNKKLTEFDRVRIEQKSIATRIFVLHPLSKETIPIIVDNLVMITYDTGSILARSSTIPLIIWNMDCIEKNRNNAGSTDFCMIFYYGDFYRVDQKTCWNIISRTLFLFCMSKNKRIYRIRDWGISRQRYWGSPIPMIMLEDGTLMPTPEEKIPVLLPEDVVMDGMKSPIKDNYKWKKIIINGKISIRDTDTFDTFLESSWYYARYTCPTYNKKMFHNKKTNYWLPVDQYVGGIEHAIIHLIYFRFFHKLIRDYGIVKYDEPAKKLLCQGMVLANTFYYIGTHGERVWVSPIEVTVDFDKKGKIKKAYDTEKRSLVYAGISKMSKSKKNGIEPKMIVKKYGSDTLRLFIIFSSPVEMMLEWKYYGVEGVHRFLKKFWKIVFNHVKKKKIKKNNIFFLNKDHRYLRNDMHKTIIKVTDDIGRRKTFNTAISSLMELINNFYLASKKNKKNYFLLQESLLVAVSILYPFTPHICFLFWHALGEIGDIDIAPWPIYKKNYLMEYYILIIVQINGKVRLKMNIPPNTKKKKLCMLAAKDQMIAKYFQEVTMHQIIYVPKKLINILVI